MQEKLAILTQFWPNLPPNPPRPVISWVAKFKGDHSSECKLSNGRSRSYREIKLLLSAGKWVVAKLQGVLVGVVTAEKPLGLRPPKCWRGQNSKIIFSSTLMSKTDIFHVFWSSFFSSLLCRNFGPGTDRQPEPLREKTAKWEQKMVWEGKFLRPCGSQSLLAFSLAHPLSPAVSMGPLQGPHNLKIHQKHQMLLLRGRITSRHYKRQTWGKAPKQETPPKYRTQTPADEAVRAHAFTRMQKSNDWDSFLEFLSALASEKHETREGNDCLLLRGGLHSFSGGLNDPSERALALPSRFPTICSMMLFLFIGGGTQVSSCNVTSQGIGNNAKNKGKALAGNTIKRRSKVLSSVCFSVLGVSL